VQVRSDRAVIRAYLGVVESQELPRYVGADLVAEGLDSAVEPERP
jgi:hypothetical protein